jgi:hypothetical protein
VNELDGYRAAVKRLIQIGQEMAARRSSPTPRRNELLAIATSSQQLSQQLTATPTLVGKSALRDATGRLADRISCGMGMVWPIFEENCPSAESDLRSLVDHWPQPSGFAELGSFVEPPGPMECVTYGSAQSALAQIVIAALTAAKALPQANEKPAPRRLALLWLYVRYWHGVGRPHSYAGGPDVAELDQLFHAARIGAKYVDGADTQDLTRKTLDQALKEFDPNALPLDAYPNLFE